MNLPGSALSWGITTYRRTLKRFGRLHSALYAIVRNALIPLMEKATGFHTMGDDPLWLRIALTTGSYEREIVRLIKQLVKPGMTALDIGAHVGYYSRQLSQFVGKHGRVIAFEPHPHTFGVLCRNTQALGNVTAVQAAITDQETTASLYDYLLGPATASLRYGEHKRDWYKNRLSDEITPRMRQNLPVASYAVKTMTVDSYLAGARIAQVDFIKMDIEGAEINALQGMRRTVRASPRLVLIMEFNPRAWQSFGVDPAKVWEELHKTGFAKIMVIEEHGGLTQVENGNMAAQLAHKLLEKMTRTNLLCVREG